VVAAVVTHRFQHQSGAVETVPCRGIALHLRLWPGPSIGRTIKKTRLTEEQIIGISHEQVASAKCARRPTDFALAVRLWAAISGPEGSRADSADALG
jgi:hypothetical protein